LLPRAVINSQPIYLDFGVGATAILGLALYGIAGLIALFAYWPRGLDSPPDPGEVINLTTRPEQEIKRIVVREMGWAHAKNRQRLVRKLRVYRIALVVGGIATATLAIGVIIQLAEYTRSWG